MKALAFVLLLATSVAASDEAPRVVVDTTTFRPGQVQVVTIDGSVTVSVSRRGDTRHVKVERLGLTNEYTLEPVEGVLTVTRVEAERPILAPHRIVIDGVPLDRLPSTREPRGPVRYYICPKDEAMLRVPHSRHSGELKCPVDGTPMKPAVGRGNAYFLLH
jgi:hypothetical protein